MADAIVEADSARKIRATQSCPNCGLPPAQDVTRLNRGVWLADYICPLGHIWFVKWVA